MDMVPRRKIVNQIDYATDYSDEYNMLIQWKSAKRPITGTWKLFGENQIFKEFKKITNNCHPREFISIYFDFEEFKYERFRTAAKIISAKQLLTFSLIMSSKSYIEGLLDILGLIGNEVNKKTEQFINNSIEERLHYIISKLHTEEARVHRHCNRR